MPFYQTECKFIAFFHKRKLLSIFYLLLNHYKKALKRHPNQYIFNFFQRYLLKFFRI